MIFKKKHPRVARGLVTPPVSGRGPRKERKELWVCHPSLEAARGGWFTDGDTAPRRVATTIAAGTTAVVPGARQHVELQRVAG